MCPQFGLCDKQVDTILIIKNLKEKYSFEELCKSPELAAEVAFGPINEFDFDVAILFSDILFILEALGLN